LVIEGKVLECGWIFGVVVCVLRKCSKIWFRKVCLGIWFRILIIKKDDFLNPVSSRQKIKRNFPPNIKKICSGQNFAEQNEIQMIIF